MKFLLILSALLVCVLAQKNRRVFESDCRFFCLTAFCVPVTQSNCDGRVQPHGPNDCNCCGLCIKQLSAGDACQMNVLSGTIGTHAECGKGLHCDHSTQTCVATKRATGPCEKQLQDYLSKQQHLLGEPKPRCETDGTFSPKQCSGSGCYCADADGNDIGYFTSYSSSTDSMDCKCARDRTAYIKSGLIGKFFFCDKKGSYEKVQCLGSVCYCADTDGKALTNSVGVPIQNKDTLNC